MYGTFHLPLKSCFSIGYAEARSRFLAAAGQYGELVAYYNPNAGPTGERLAVDTVWIGLRNASKVLVLVSGTHGVEGFCGSAAQLDFLLSGGAESLPADTAVLLIHALNPYGFAWLRRTTEEGVDLNRNGLDFSKPLPSNPGFDELREYLLPRQLSGPIFEAAQAQIESWRARHGEVAFESARSGGQYTDPNGLFYGGRGPTWSMNALSDIADHYDLKERAQVAVIDYHTGLGPFGYGEPIVGHRPGEPGQARCRAWYGQSLGEPLLGTSSSLPIPGLTQYAWERHVGSEVLTFIALEFGTYPRSRGRAALMADQWLHVYGNLDWYSAESQFIKQEIKTHYFPDTDDWNEMMILRSRQVVRQALNGIARSSQERQIDV